MVKFRLGRGVVPESEKQQRRIFKKEENNRQEENTYLLLCRHSKNLHLVAVSLLFNQKSRVTEKICLALPEHGLMQCIGSHCSHGACVNNIWDVQDTAGP